MTKRLQSIHHPQIKRLIRLKAGKESGGYCLVEGQKLIEEVLANSLGFSLETFFYAEVLSREEKQFAASLSGRIKEQYELPHLLLKRVSGLVAPSPFLGLVRRNTLAQEPTKRRLDFCLVFCDRLQDPGNLGTLFRSGLAFQVDGFYLSTGTAHPFAEKVIRGSMGAVFHTPVYEQQDLAACFSRWRGQIPLFAADPRGASCYSEVDLSRPFGLLIGNEGGGIDPVLLDSVDEKLAIPMEGRTDSLNAAVTCSIILAEARRQRRVGAKAR